MLIIEIDRFDAQPTKAPVARAADILGRAIDAFYSFGTDAEAKFGCDDYAIARDLAQETSNQFLVFVRTVDFGRIQKIPPEL
jgi:hypothetical protein